MPLQAAFAFNANELFTSLGNMIISQWVESDNIAKDGKSLLTVFKTDGSLYGVMALKLAGKTGFEFTDACMTLAMCQALSPSQMWTHLIFIP